MVDLQDLLLLIALGLVVVGLVGYFVTKGKAGRPAAVPPSLSSAPVRAGAGAAVGAAAGSSTKPGAAVEEVDHSLCPISVFYGSQTGSAEGFAKQVVNEAKKHGFRPKLVDLEAFSPDTSLAPQSPDFPPLAVFIMATYGEGDPTDNASEFVKWLKDPVRARQGEGRR
jgi:sulfite reductase alpha subunit-like flavoprotein